MKLTNKHKRGVRRKVEMEGDKTLNHSSVFVNKKKYTRIKKNVSNIMADVWRKHWQTS